jgi:hypothetical protein
MKRHITTVVVVALSIAMFLALAGPALAVGRIKF